MIADPKELLREATELAVLMVDQIQYVDVLDVALSAQEHEPVREDGSFSLEATAYVRYRKRLDDLKYVIVGTARKIAASELATKHLNPHEVDCAAEMVTNAVKGMLIAQSAGNGWLRDRRLVIKFDTVEWPWIQGQAGRRGVFYKRLARNQPVIVPN